MGLNKIPSSFYWKQGNFTFYKLEIPTFQSKKEAVFNFGDNFVGVGGVVNWVLRLGLGKNGEQYFIEYNRSFHDVINVKEFKANAGSKGKKFCEAYLPLESLEFTKKCMDVFIKIKKEKKLVDKSKFLSIVKEVFNDNKNI